MNTINSTLSSKVPPILKRVKSINNKLVNILNHKMFKGFSEIKESKVFNIKRPKYIDNNFWENKILDPFDDCYNLEYKKKNLSSIYSKDLTNMLQINNYSRKSKSYIKKPTKSKKINSPQKNNNFQRKQNINIRKKCNNDKYFYFSSNSLLIKNDFNNYSKEQKTKLFKKIFPIENEKGLYNDIPIFAIEKIHKIKESKKKKFIYLPSREERMNDLQFLYKVSHQIPWKKIDFRNKYNIKSATQRQKVDTIKNAVIRSLPHKIQSAKPNKNRLSLKFNSIDIFMTTIRNNINNDKILNDKKSLNKDKKNNDLNSKQFQNTILKRAQSSSGYRSRNIRLVKNNSNSTCSFSINKDLLFNREKTNNNEIKCKLNYFPTMDRFINDQIILNYINFKKRKFENLKNMIEY